MKGDASIWSASHFRSNTRCAPSTHVALCNEMRDAPWYAHLQHDEKGDTRTRGTSRIISPWPKSLGLTLSLTTLNNFLLPSNALAIHTILLPLPVVLDPNPRACHYLVPGLKACHHRPLHHALDTVAPPLVTSTPPPSECITIVLFLRACCRHPLPQSMLPLSSSLECAVAVDLDPTSLGMKP
jgi:hypothetical protein